MYTHYEEYIANVSMVFGADPDTAQRDAKDIVDLDLELARVIRYYYINMTNCHNSEINEIIKTLYSL